MRVLVVVLLAAAGAALTYLGLERLGGRRALVPMAARAVAWAALGLLLLNVSCPVSAAPRRPLVLLDASLSMTAAGGQWARARQVAESLGEVRRFGDERGGADTLPDRGRSQLAASLVAASASDRPVWVVTDGEVEDAADIPADILARTGVRLLPRSAVPDIAITAVRGPARITAGDSIPLELDLRGTAGAPDSVTVAVTAGDQRLGRQTVRLEGGAARLRWTLPSRGLAAGDHVLRVALAGTPDREPRDDARLQLVSVAATPGVVLLAAPADWDARFLFHTVRDVAQLPVKGFVRIAPDRWRSMADMSPVSSDEVRLAARHADLLLLKGAPGDVARDASARGVLTWPSGEDGETVLAGDWYLKPSAASPVAGAFLGLPVDSFPPATQVTAIEPAAGEWTALTAQLARRGAERPVVIGREQGRVRRVTVAADGLWRWAFRGGSSEEAYRSWIAATVSWLLGGADSVRGAAQPLRAVVQNGRPVLFEWIGAGAPRALAIGFGGAGPGRSDTLRFDGAGHASVWLPVGEYHYRIAEGGQGTVAVESYSDEWLPRPVALAARAPVPPARADVSAARDWLWLFAIAVAALAIEWYARRRMGLR